MPRDVAGAVRQLKEALQRAKVHRQKRALERKLERAMRKAFRAQGKDFLTRFKLLEDHIPLAEALREEDINDWVDWEILFDEAIEATLQFFVGPIDATTTTAVLQGAAEVIADVGASIAFDLENPRAQAFLQGRAAARVTMINDTTRDRLRTLITRGIEAGDGYTAIANAIADEFEAFAVGRPQKHIETRAHLVAVTEIGEAYSEANLMAGLDLVDAGIEMEKKWDDVGDELVSDGCQANSAAGWIDINATFPSGHKRTLRHPGCRCDLLMRAKGAED